MQLIKNLLRKWQKEVYESVHVCCENLLKCAGVREGSFRVCAKSKFATCHTLCAFNKAAGEKKCIKIDCVSENAINVPWR